MSTVGVHIYDESVHETVCTVQGGDLLQAKRCAQMRARCAAVEPAADGDPDLSAGDVLIAAKRMAQARRRAHERDSRAARSIQGLVRSAVALSNSLSKEPTTTMKPRVSLGSDCGARRGFGSPLTPVSPNKRRTSLDALAAKRKSIDGAMGEGSPLRASIFDAVN